MLQFITTVFTLLKPVFTFVLGLLWKVIQKLTPIVFHELYLLAKYVFAQAQSEAAYVLTKYTVQEKLKAIYTDAVSHFKLFISTLDIQEKLALVIAPVVFFYFVFNFIF